jgi:hypothetical protein
LLPFRDLHGDGCLPCDDASAAEAAMSALSAKLRKLEGGRIAFWCPGCDGAHAVNVFEPAHPRWTYSGDPETPTFGPSIRVTYNGPDAGQVRESGHRAPPACCHFFVRNGMMEFCSDSTHALAGKTVPLPDFPS